MRPVFVFALAYSVWLITGTALVPELGGWADPLAVFFAFLCPQPMIWPCTYKARGLR